MAVEPLVALKLAIADVKIAPRDQEIRRRLRAVAAEGGMWEQLALLLEDEARATVRQPELAAAFFEELADVHENLDQPLEAIAAMENVVDLQPEDVEHRDRLAWLYRRAGAAVKAAESFERVAEVARDDRARAALRAAGRLYREAGKRDEAIRVYRAIVQRRRNDLEAWRALDELLTDHERWPEAAEVRSVLAEYATGIDKAVALRALARALEHAGDRAGAEHAVATAARYAPDDISGIVDYATVLAREGRAKEAATVLGERIQESIADGAPSANVAALRLRLVDMLEAGGDHLGAATALDKLLQATPEYVPALERLVAQAAQGDPREHAAVLLRLAAALGESPDAATHVIDAARRFRDAGDTRAAARGFERAAELRPDDDALREELENVRTALVVEVAQAEATAGDLKGAERRLRTILAQRPLHVDANLALVELLVKTDRANIAAEHLRQTLADAPEATPPEMLAKLVFRYATSTAALGDPDGAHQLLHEAHHLSRRDLLITLALGESCFARKLWREAAIHLGSLADHAEAYRHATAVAAGLVKAGQAEVRALKPTNAQKHYEAAVRLDPKCAPAWHQLAELASERGDTIAAADFLELEATSTVDLPTRIRLYDALGDLALDVLGDEARAERCWAAIAMNGHAPTLVKLLSLQRKRGATISRGETCERLAAVSDKLAFKTLTEEAAEAFGAGGDHARARAVVDYLISQYPLDVDTIACASAIAANDADAVASWLRRALGAWDAAGNRAEGDGRRAELWRRLGDAEKARRNERAALDAYQRAVVTAPESDGALVARRALIDLAASFGRNANTSRMALIEAEQQPDDIIASARELARTDEIEDARAMYELARALHVELIAEDEQFLDANPARAMASDEAYATVLDDEERSALIDDPDDGPLGELLTMLGEAANLLCGDAKAALDREALTDARRIPATSDAAAAAIYPQIAKALAGPATLLYESPQREAADLRLLLASPPVLVLGPRLATARARSRSDADLELDAELRFHLGRMVELARPHRLFAAADRDGFPRLITALVDAFAPVPNATAAGDQLRGALPIALRKRIADKLATLGEPLASAADLVGELDVAGYVAACDRAADRAGLIACGHSTVAIRLAGGGRHVVELAASQRYLAARKKLRRR